VSASAIWRPRNVHLQLIDDVLDGVLEHVDVLVQAPVHHLRGNGRDSELLSGTERDAPASHHHGSSQPAYVPASMSSKWQARSKAPAYAEARSGTTGKGFVAEGLKGKSQLGGRWFHDT